MDDEVRYISGPLLQRLDQDLQECERQSLLRLTANICNHHLWIYLTILHTRVHTFNGPFSGTTQVSWYRKGKINLDFAEARDGEWQWYQLGHMQVCTLLQTDNHTSTQFFTARPRPAGV